MYFICAKSMCYNKDSLGVTRMGRSPECLLPGDESEVCHYWCEL